MTDNTRAVPIRAAVTDPLLSMIPLGARMVVELAVDGSSIAAPYQARSPATRFISLNLTSHRDEHAQALLARLDGLTVGRNLDAVVMTSGLQMLDDPRALLAALRHRCAPGAVCLIAAPNVAHWSIIAGQLAGHWLPGQSTEQPPAQCYTRETLVELLRDAGWTAVDATPLVGDAEQPTAALDALGTAAQAWGIVPTNLKDDLGAVQWIGRATNGPTPSPITVAALGMKKVAGVTDARIDHPLAAMASRVSVRAAWGAGGVEVPGHWKPGVLILHRQFLDNPAFVAAIEKRIARGWIVVSEIDDDPAHWPAYAAANHRAFRGVHAVTVSTEALADVIRQWNPAVAVFPNAIPYLPETSPAAPRQGEKLRVFFGALNREADWRAVVAAIGEAARALRDRLEFVVVHDKGFFDALGSVRKSFVATLNYDAYLARLATCDIALLPLNDTPFNRLKSDIKLIECAAAGAVPICSPTVYGQDPAHAEIAMFAKTPKDWAMALKALATDPYALTTRRAAGLAYVKASRMQVHQINAREAVFGDWLRRRDELEAARQLRIA